MPTADMKLGARQIAVLRLAADNDGVIFVGNWMPEAERKAVEALKRAGFLSPGSGLHGASARHITDHGWRWLNEHEAARHG